MPNIKQQKKRDRTNEVRRNRNVAVRSRVKTFVKKADHAVSEGSAGEVDGAVREAIAEIDIAARKGVIHKRNAARRKSRLQKRANARAAK